MSKWTFKQIEPQPARGKLVESMWDDPNWIAEEKYDGDRRIAQFCGKVVRFTGRRVGVKDGLFVEKTENVPHLSAAGNWDDHAAPGVIASRVPPAALEGTVLDGEMICPPDPIAGYYGGGLSKYVTSIMGSLPEEAVRKQIERGWLRYVVFDCLWYKGKDIRGYPLRDRRVALVSAVKEWANPFATVGDWSAAKRGYLKTVLDRSGEGVILKNTSHRYGDKNGWVKVKAEITEDVVVMGYKPAKELSTKKGADAPTMTKYAAAGLIGAVIFGQYKGGKLVECGACSGMDDGVRAELTKRGKKYIGEVIEIKANGREPTGAFRHPRMVGFRPDKSARDCVWS